jgi:hypothetical protein
MPLLEKTNLLHSKLNEVVKQFNVLGRRTENKKGCRGELLLLLWLNRPLFGLGRFISFLIPYIVGRTPWTGDQPDARPLPAHRTIWQSACRIRLPNDLDY